MNLSLLLMIAWVLSVSLVGMLPRVLHKRLGFPLLALLPFLLADVGWELGIWWALGLTAAALSIYRYPAKYYGLRLLAKLTGRAADD